MRPQIQITTRHNAMHPVARAVAQANLISSVRTFQLRLHLLNTGENVLPDMAICDTMFRIVSKALDTDGYEPDRVMRGAHSAVKQCLSRDGVWYVQDATAIDQGLKHLVDIYPQLKARSVTAAWQKLEATA